MSPPNFKIMELLPQERQSLFSFHILLNVEVRLEVNELLDNWFGYISVQGIMSSLAANWLLCEVSLLFFFYFPDFYFILLLAFACFSWLFSFNTKLLFCTRHSNANEQVPSVFAVGRSCVFSDLCAFCRFKQSREITVGRKIKFKFAATAFHLLLMNNFTEVVQLFRHRGNNVWTVTRRTCGI